MRNTLLSAMAMVMIASAGWSQEAAPAAGWTPTEPVDIVVHSAAGSGNDLLAREFISIVDQEDLAPVNFVVLNKTGGGGSTAALNYLHSKAGDPYTMGIGSNNWITDNLMQQEAQYGVLDVTPLALLGEEPFVLLTRADSSYATLQDFVQAATEKKGALNLAGSSQFSRQHVVSIAIEELTGAKWNYVTFPSRGERTAALLGGHADVSETDAIEARELVRSGRARALALFSPERLEAFPDVPTIQEVYDVPHLALVRHVALPPDMPAEVVAYYADLVRRVTETDLWRTYAQNNGLFTPSLTPEETRAFMQAHRENIRGFSTAAGATLVR